MAHLTSKIEFHYEKLDGSTVFDSLVMIGEVGEKLTVPTHQTLSGFHILTEKLSDTLTFLEYPQEFLVLYVPDYQQLYVRILDSNGTEKHQTLTSKTRQKFDLSKLNLSINPDYQMLVTYQDDSGQKIKQVMQELPEIIADATSNGNCFFDAEPQILEIEYAEKVIDMTLRYVLGETDIELAPPRLLAGELGELIVEEIPVTLDNQDYLFDKIRQNSARRYINCGGELIYEYTVNTALINQAQFALMTISDEKMSAQALALKNLLTQKTATAAAIKNLTAIVTAENATIPKPEVAIDNFSENEETAEISLAEIMATLHEVRDILSTIDTRYQRINAAIDALRTTANGEPIKQEVDFTVSEDAAETLASLMTFRDKIFEES